MTLPDSSILTNIRFAGNESEGNSLFEKKYISIRCMENRLYTDDQVARLPDISKNHTHYAEWMIRKQSSNRLIQYLSGQQRRLDILEVGCGNGWLAHGLSGIPRSEVTGLDINFTELQQAARVFNENAHLHFIYGDLSSGILKNQLFDVIVFAASIQYFQYLTAVLFACQKLLRPGGEIHLIDSPIYDSRGIGKARERTFLYYDSLGYPEMSDYYFHHDIHDLKGFRHKILRNPSTILNRFSRSKKGFYWICVKNE
jgi:ubiquinone/menaquinone biosynthesis C-methylase UbiE